MIIDFFEYTIGTNSIDNSYCITAIEFREALVDHEG